MTCQRENIGDIAKDMHELIQKLERTSIRYPDKNPIEITRETLRDVPQKSLGKIPGSTLRENPGTLENCRSICKSREELQSKSWHEVYETSPKTSEKETGKTSKPQRDRYLRKIPGGTPAELWMKVERKAPVEILGNTSVFFFYLGRKFSRSLGRNSWQNDGKTSGKNPLEKLQE